MGIELSVFERTAAKAEKLANKNYTRYKVTLFLFALLGYLVIYGTITLAISSLSLLIYATVFQPVFIVALIKSKFGLLLIPFIWILLRACWIKIEAPTGYELTRTEYPELFAEIDALQKALRAPKIHKVILDEEANAAIQQSPRLGILGWRKNTLNLGMELLLILSKEQMRAVIAHEFGHLSGNHNRFERWIYRIRISWIQLMKAFDRQHSLGGVIMARFFMFYAPRFSAWSFVLARSNEYEADKIATELTSVAELGQALVSTRVVAPYIREKYWQDFFNLADDNIKPPFLPWSGLQRFLSENTACRAELSKALRKQLKVKTAFDDTHPSLSDRLAEIGYRAEPPQEIAQTAAQTLLAEQYDKVVKRLDAKWLAKMGKRWQERYEHVQNNRKRMAALKEYSTDILNEQEHWELCHLTSVVESEDKAFKLVAEFQKKYPDSAKAAYVMGLKLFQEKNRECLRHFELAVKDPDLVIQSCQMARQLLLELNESTEKWDGFAQEQIKKDRAAEIERNELTTKDKFIKANIDEETKTKIKLCLMEKEPINSAWVAEKEVQYRNDKPMLAIAVALNGWIFSEDSVLRWVNTHLDIEADFIIVPEGGEHKAIFKKVVNNGELLFKE